MLGTTAGKKWAKKQQNHERSTKSKPKNDYKKETNWWGKYITTIKVSQKFVTSGWGKFTLTSEKIRKSISKSAELWWNVIFLNKYISENTRDLVRAFLHGIEKKIISQQWQFFLHNNPCDWD